MKTSINKTLNVKAKISLLKPREEIAGTVHLLKKMFIVTLKAPFKTLSSLASQKLIKSIN
jgi:hypothetical protein